MKKISMFLCIVLAIACCIVLGSCGHRSLDEIKESGVLYVGTNAEFPPYEYYEGEKVTGFDIELAQYIAAELGVKLEIMDVQFNSILAGVKSGKMDIGLAGLTITEERQKSVDFSTPYVQATQVVITRAESPVQSLDDLGEGTKIGTQNATTGFIYASDIECAIVTPYEKGADAVMDLKNGKVDCVIIDNLPAREFVKANPELTILEDPFEDEFYAAAVAKGNTELLDVINKVIADMKADGRYDALMAKYINE